MIEGQATLNQYEYNTENSQNKLSRVDVPCLLLLAEGKPIERVVESMCHHLVLPPNQAGLFSHYVSCCPLSCLLEFSGSVEMVGSSM